MTRIITAIVLLLVELVTAQNKTETQLQSALENWNNNQKELATTQFEQIATNDSQNWLAQYYVAYSNVVLALNAKDNKDQMKTLLVKAQEAQDKLNVLQPDNAEVLVLQALINTGWIVFNPMVNGQKMSGDVDYIYKRAFELAPENPRVLLCKTEFEMGRARFFGMETKSYCEQFKKVVELFSTFKPQSSVHPNWGLEKVNEDLVKCNL